MATIKAKPVWGDILEKNVSKASSPPAEAPMPATGSTLPATLSGVLWLPFLLPMDFTECPLCCYIADIKNDTTHKVTV